MTKSLLDEWKAGDLRKARAFAEMDDAQLLAGYEFSLDMLYHHFYDDAKKYGYLRELRATGFCRKIRALMRKAHGEVWDYTGKRGLIPRKR